jgi:diguanylate cyclase (GGDEF)-like protein
LLTGLPNRTLLADRLQQAIAQADRNGYYAAVAFIDLDNFKYINDSLGHQAGDNLLVEVSRRLQGCLRGTDTVARYGGDEFVLVLNNHYQAVSVIRLMERVLDDIQRPVVVDGTDLFVTPSIGISLYPNDGSDAQTLIKNADAAMYLAKGKGRNNFQFFTRRLNDLAMERIGLDSSLRRALARNEIQVHFQPKVNRHRHVFGFEALVRWNSPEHGWVSPEKFISVAEDTGMIVPITEFVLDAACRQAVAWSAAGLGHFSMAVNLSVRMLQDDNVTALVERTLRQSGLAPQRLELEITESMIIGNIEHSVALLHQLKALGVQLAIDDFGTGYSSLSYLQRFPMDTLKIDRAFVRSLDLQIKESPIAKLVTLLGHSLGLTVVAEGVETESQLEYLKAIGCDAYQGFLFARPMPAGEIERTLLLPDAAVAMAD